MNYTTFKKVVRKRQIHALIRFSPPMEIRFVFVNLINKSWPMPKWLNLSPKNF
jgi:hypothetical protein